MNQLLEAFILGNSAILTNVCVLPLYPGLIAYLAGNAQNERTQAATRWLGLLVLAGVLSLMLVVGAILYLLQQSFGAILPVLLPIIYGIIILLGLMMLAGRNPFASLFTI
jgi:cytochrome c-type biogenesis protein